MVGAGAVERAIAWGKAQQLLRELLQTAFGVFAFMGCFQDSQFGMKEPQQHCAAGLDRLVQIEGADQGFKGSAEGGQPLAPAIFLFPAPQQQVVAELQLERDPGQRLPPHQGRAEVGQPALFFGWVAVVEPFTEDIAQHCVAQKLETFVV